MTLFVTFGCVSLGNRLYRTGSSFELPDAEAERLMQRCGEQVMALTDSVTPQLPETDNQKSDEVMNEEPVMELPKADAAAAVQK